MKPITSLMFVALETLGNNAIKRLKKQSLNAFDVVSTPTKDGKTLSGCVSVSAADTAKPIMSFILSTPVDVVYPPEKVTYLRQSSVSRSKYNMHSARRRISCSKRLEAEL